MARAALGATANQKSGLVADIGAEAYRKARKMAHDDRVALEQPLAA